jgi:phosphopantothenoylcysteine decarboxylase/phosphopantothenate--cysteine ligase
MSFSQRKILIGVTGGIAVYKVAEVVSHLAKAGAQVRVILTKGAEAFITPLTFATLSRHPAYTDRDFWQADQGRPLHIQLAEWAELLVIAPLSANTMAKLTHGIADNLLLNVWLASTCPVLLAPAMNSTMWLNPAVQSNWHNLISQPRCHPIPPSAGVLACDAMGIGRMAEPALIVQSIESLLWTGGKRDLTGQSVLVSAGGTREFIDPVRFIGNPATGKQGMALAIAAYHRGAQVTLVLANAPSPPVPFPVIPVTTSAQLRSIMVQELARSTIVVMNSAVGDVQPRTYSPHKLPKAQLPLNLPLEFVPDIVAELAQLAKPEQQIIGFAAHTGTPAEMLEAMQSKLQSKNLTSIVGNRVDTDQGGFASDSNQAIFFHKNGHYAASPLLSKLALAHWLWDLVVKLS